MMKKKLTVILIVLLLLALAVGAVLLFRYVEMKRAPDPNLTAQEYLDSLLADSGRKRTGFFRSYELDAQYEQSYRHAGLTGSAIYVDADKLTAGIAEDMQQQLAELVEQARRSEDVYNDDKSFKEPVLKSAFEAVLTSRLSGEDCLSDGEFTMELAYDGESWSVAAVTLPWDGQSAEAMEQSAYAAATGSLQYIKKHYSIPEEATAGPTARQEYYGSTDDPAVIEALLATDAARELLGGQAVAWNRDLPFIPGREMRYYLDETLLVLQWQEVTAKAVGTFAEVVTADGSQLRRKLAGDYAFSYDFDYPTSLARQANAVLAVGGDLYNHARACGIVVYNREIFRFEPDSCDTCYITSDGDMLYSKAGQFTEQAQAEEFIRDNDVLFSLCFGPVLIEDGKDVTPLSYPWGEINDTYARSALGMLGQRHYLTMNINCEWTDYYYLATLQQATDAMLSHGCLTAYALDGGQTAATVLNGQLINVVQFNTEKLTSDMIYFATALPEEGA